MQPGCRFQHVASLLGGVRTRVVGAHRGRDDSQPLEFGQIQKIEGGNAGRNAIGGHAGELTARTGQPNEIEPIQDLVSKASIGARVERERGEVVLIVVKNFPDSVADVAGDCLALAEHFARHGIERVLVHAHERASQQVDAIEHQAAGNRGLAAAEIALRLAQEEGAGFAPEE